MGFMLFMVLTNADARCYRRGRAGELASHHIKILDLPFRHRVLRGLMFFRWISRFLFVLEKNPLHWCLDRVHTNGCENRDAQENKETVWRVPED